MMLCYHQNLLLIGTGHNTKNKTVLITLTLTLTLPHSPCHYYNVIIYLLIIIICRVVCSIIIYSASLDLHVGQKLNPPLHHRSSMIDLFANIANSRASNSINCVITFLKDFGHLALSGTMTNYTCAISIQFCASLCARFCAR